MATRATYYEKRLAMGSITPDQIAEREGDPPVPGNGRKYFVSRNLTPIDRAGEDAGAGGQPPAEDPADGKAGDGQLVDADQADAGELQGDPAAAGEKGKP